MRLIVSRSSLNVREVYAQSGTVSPKDREVYAQSGTLSPKDRL